MTRIAILNPVIDTGAVPMQALASYAQPGIILEPMFLDHGPSSIENEADVAACTPHVLEIGSRLAESGVDAIIVNCMCDPGVAQLRARCAIPVLGPAEATMHYAAGLGLRFAVIDVVEGAEVEVRAQVRDFGVGHAFAGYWSIKVPVLALHTDPVRTVEALAAASRLAADAGATAILLGCTGLADLADMLAERLFVEGVRCSVIEPLRVTIGLAAMAAAGHH
ncbi:aspartate/glutamate racemase family protein [Sphingosinicella sp.]|jgi:allantoin racemase|uniref:aspartate/glutamate racemase family protein n=1 Tax=Sphingosinicella sp. TaxID=1917971 RepID=UPI0035B2B4E0